MSTTQSVETVVLYIVFWRRFDKSDKMTQFKSPSISAWALRQQILMEILHCKLGACSLKDPGV